MSERILRLSGTKRGAFIKGNGMTMYTIQRIKIFPCCFLFSQMLDYVFGDKWVITH